MKPRLLGGITMLAAAMAMMGQPTKPVPTTTLTSSSPTLQLPGSLTLTATVAPPAATGGVPTGNVEFFNGTASLGTGALAAIPSTQNFSAPPLTTNIGLSPFGLFTLPSGTPPNSVLGLLDWYLASVDFYAPQVTILGSNPVQITNSNFFYNITTGQGSIDSYAIADFNQDGYPDVLLHGSNGNTDEYYLLPGTAGNGFDPTAKVISPDAAPCNCVPVTVTIIADDFNEDGYPDVAYAIPNFGATSPLITNLIGVALNEGAAAKGSFKTFKSAPRATNGTKDWFSPTALASGHFTLSGHADLVVAGYFVSPQGLTALPGNIALFPGNGDGTFGTPAVFTGSDGTTPTAVATADLRRNGMTDVVLANEVPASDPTPAPTNTVQVLFGDGKGGLTTSSTVTVPAAPAALTITDFNNDGYPDILVTGADGSLNLLLNDGTGHFSTTTAIGKTLNVSSLTTSDDYNRDGLADIVEITRFPVSTNVTTSTRYLLLNSASSQATFDTPPKTLPAGTDTLTAIYRSDNNFAASTSQGVDVMVTQTVPAITWPAPPAMQYGTALSAIQLNATANVPGSFTYSPATGTVLPLGQTKDTAVFAPMDSFDYSGATATQTITVIAAPANATATAPATTDTGQTDSASLTVNSYPAPITATLNLSFTPAPPNMVPDPAVLFPNNTTTEVIQIPANSTTNQSVDFNTGSTAGTITLTTKLTLSSNPGTDVTPTTLAPLNISVPAAPPVITSVQLTRSGQTMTAAIVGLSSTRDMSQAQFHFTAASGKDLKTTDLPVNLSSPFGTWYGSSDSDAHGTNFLYTQPFTLNSDATTVGSVTVTLTNSKGASQPSTAQ